MWRCARCGTANIDETAICMSCGNIRQKSGFSLKGLLAGLKKLRMPPQLKGKAPVVAAGALVLLMLILSVVSLSFHGKARDAYESHDYEKAAEYAEKDFLFGGKLRKNAYRALGDDCMDDGEYAQAAEYYEKLGKAGYDSWVEAIYALAQEQMEEGDYLAALESFTLIQDEEKGKAGRNDALYMCALSKAMDGENSAARDYISQMDEDYAKEEHVQNIFEEAQFQNASLLLLRGDYAAAAAGYEKCKDYGDTEKTWEAAKRLSQGRYYDAACSVRNYSGSGNGQLQQYIWCDVFTDAVNRVATDDADSLLSINAALSVFSEGREAIYSGWDLYEVRELFPESLLPSGIETCIGYDKATPVDMTIRTESGTAPKGKILVLWQVHNYHTKQTEYAIAWELMQLLPEELYPENLESVEFIVRIGYDYQVDGWYEFSESESVTAFQEYAKVITEKAGSRKQIYMAYTVWGKEAPDNVYRYQVTDGYISGGAPDRYDMAETFYKAVNAAINYVP